MYYLSLVQITKRCKIRNGYFDKTQNIASQHRNVFRITGSLWGEATGHMDFRHREQVLRSFDVFFDVGLNKLLNKQSSCRALGYNDPHVTSLSKQIYSYDVYSTWSAS